MEHAAKDGPKLLHHCTLPLTGVKVVDLVITDLGVFTIDKHGFRGMALVELAPGTTLDEIAAKTEATYRVALGSSALPQGEPRFGHWLTRLLPPGDQPAGERNSPAVGENDLRLARAGFGLPSTLSLLAPAPSAGP